MAHYELVMRNATRPIKFLEAHKCFSFPSYFSMIPEHCYSPQLSYSRHGRLIHRHGLNERARNCISRNGLHWLWHFAQRAGIRRCS
jgi:hypothetical protein